MGAKILDRLFPEFVVTEEMELDEVIGSLYPEESVFVAKAVEKRKNDFTGGRICARKALAKLGINKFPVLMTKDRAPVWPNEIAGSISHTHGYCGVAIVSKERAKSIGLDIERISRVKKECRPYICTDNEIATLSRLPEKEQNMMVALTFSAKECFYKCQYAIDKKWAGFMDAEIFADVNKSESEFEIRLVADIGPSFQKNASFKGKYIFNNDYVLTGMII